MRLALGDLDPVPKDDDASEGAVRPSKLRIRPLGAGVGIRRIEMLPIGAACGWAAGNQRIAAL